VTVVAGATGGIGYAVAKRLRADNLLLLGRNSTKLASLQGEFPNARVERVDFADEDSIAKALTGLNHIDRLIHSTGAVATAPIAFVDRAEVDEILGANYLAPLLLTKLAIPLLRARGGSVVFVNSGAGKRVRPEWSVYSASKFAVRTLAEGLALEEPSIRVLSVFIGPVATEMRESLGEVPGVDFAAGDYLDPDEVAAGIEFALQLRSDVTVSEIDMRVRKR
jgi:NAD(P)-dependent dehydrogenase (short-subunit alcohol dehydrogenase family)